MDNFSPRPNRALSQPVTLPPFSPAYVSADDAARYAHERIGKKRDVEYGSVILRRLSDNRFLATEPLADKQKTFSWLRLLERGANGDFLHPPGYAIVASLHSHPMDYAFIKQMNPKISDRQNRAFNSFYSDLDVSFNYYERGVFSHAYLSGPDGTLLKYTPAGSEAERQYVLWLDTQGPFSSVHAHDGTVEGIFTKLASVGQLEFLSSSETWGGSLGVVPSDWKPYEAFRSAPGQVACGPVSPGLDLALAHAQTRIGRTPNARQWVFVFKHQSAEEYLTTDPVVIERTRLPPDSDFPLLSGGPLIPEGFVLHGFFYVSRPIPSQFSQLDPWLYRQFFSPYDLAACIAQSRKYPTPHGLSLYMRTQDGALLKYRFSGSAAESQLLKNAAEDTTGDHGIQQQLLEGTLSPRRFIRDVAQAGELTVKQPSTVWDVKGVVGPEWEPCKTFAQPGLSAAFLSMDDAARYLHGRVEPRRDREFGALILQRADQRYVATTLYETGSNPFAYAQFYPRDSNGTMIGMPEGHQIVAGFGSHAALSTMDMSYVQTMKWSRMDADVYAQTFTDIEAHGIHGRQVPGYLSGAEDSLIVLEPTGSGAEKFLQWFETPFAGKSVVGKHLENGTYKPADVVRKMAEVSRLRVLLGNSLWGPARQIDGQWQPFEAVLQYQRPERVTFGAVFDNADDAVLYAADHALQSLEAESHFAVLLKHESRSEYVMSECVPLTWSTQLFRLTDLFTLSQGAWSVPQGFEFEALYYTSGDTGSWQARHFIPPRVLYEALETAKTIHLGKRGDLTLYFTTLERAVLKYRLDEDTELYALADGGYGPEDQERKLSTGTLTGQGLVREVAGAGELVVLRTDGCWDRAGTVDQMWVPYANLQRRNLSPTFTDMNDAARYVQRLVGTDRPQRYGGLILRCQDGSYSATLPRLVLDDAFQRDWIFPDEMVSRGLFPERTNVVGRYLSQPSTELPILLSAVEKDVYRNMFSTRAIQAIFNWPYDPLKHYLMASDGALISLRPLDVSSLIAEHESPRAARKDWRQSTAEKQLRDGVLRPSDYVKRLARFCDLRVVNGSRLWGPAGRVLEWEPNRVAQTPTGYERATQDPAFSPLFLQADDAVRHVHQLPRDGHRLTFGFVLKSATDARYVATLPVTDENSGFAHRRVFSVEGYPYRHVLAGIYFNTPQAAGFPPPGTIFSESRFAGLFSPVDLANALGVYRTSQQRNSLPVYVSCADGALLRYQLKASGGVDQYSVAQSRFQALRNGQLSASGYVQLLASAGDLDVLVPSKNWLGAGRVGASHQLGRTQPTPSDNLLLLGPMFIHPDDAAQYAQKQVGAFSAKEYLGAVLCKSGAHSYVPVQPMYDPLQPSIAAQKLFGVAPSKRSVDLPSGYEIYAAHQFYRTGLDQPAQRQEEHLREYFVSWRELGLYTHGLKDRGIKVLAYYLSSRDGALIKYQPNYSDDEYELLNARGKWSEQGGYTADAPKPSVFISALAQNSVLEIVRFGTFWRPRGVLGTDLKLETKVLTQKELRQRDEL
jgi:hypothetical protein